MAATAMDGAIQSTRTEKPQGMLNTCIGWSHLWSGAVLPHGFALNDLPLEKSIGPYSGDQVNDVGAVAAKGLKLLQASGAVAIDGVVSAGWLNKTGHALATGDYVMAVQA
jgi:hypothetical protein